MLHYWPRVSMALTIRDIDPLKYVEETHGAGVPPLVHDNEIEVDFEVVQALLGQAEQNCTGIDYLLYDLVQRHSNILAVLRQPLDPVVSSPASVVSRQFSCEQLLTINLAARQARNLLEGESKAVAQKIQDWSFQCANAKITELLFKSDDESVPFLLLSAYILMSDVYPIGALKLIQAAGDRLGRCSRRPINDEIWKERLYCCLRLHHIIESEILLTMDGLPSESVSAALNQISYIKTLKEVETGYVNLSVAEIAKLKLSEHISETTFAICGIQNKVLTQVYSIEQAYSRPSMLAHAISDLKTQLCAWFDALPLEWHFPRDLSSVMSMPSPATSFLRPLRIKYYLVEFLMCRPVLYYIAHESFENSADHPIDPSPGESTTSQENHPFWVYDACYRCLQCAALLIVDEKPMVSENLGRFQRDWFEVHMFVQPPRTHDKQKLTPHRIWGAALTLVVAVGTPSLAKFLPKHGNTTDSMSLLNLAEEILQAASQQSGVIARCTAYLRNVKENMINNNNENNNHLMHEAVLDDAYHDTGEVDETVL
ncbi:unnamed protein product [Clonostachys rosea]|uniref:Transcription factor domain-containing protein n=1 Tax=Bionectria ochroleuca TaxID=29856 RepID=A0ABY6V2B8_BIOOC|nr:unnamed protein product [Clonostachys rosea]